MAGAIGQRPWTVLLTGSTGSSGYASCIRAATVTAREAARVYCPEIRVRRRAGEAVRSSLSSPSPPTARQPLVFIKASLGSPKFGLDRVVYKQLTDEVTVIIHNAWTVNLCVLPGEAFLPNLGWVWRNLLSLLILVATAPNLFAPGFRYRISISWGNSTSREVIFHDLAIEHEAGPAFKVRRGENGGGVHGAQMACRRPYYVSVSIAGPVQFRWRLAGPGSGFLTLLRASRHIGAPPILSGRNNDLD